MRFSASVRGRDRLVLKKRADRVARRHAPKPAARLFDMRTHRGFADFKNLGDLFRLVMTRHQAKDFLLPVGQRSDAGHRIL
jgi:hypothetical protein